jgi:hypothetical protein
VPAGFAGVVGGLACASTGAMLRHTRLAATAADGSFIELS